VRFIFVAARAEAVCAFACADCGVAGTAVPLSTGAGFGLGPVFRRRAWQLSAVYGAGRGGDDGAVQLGVLRHCDAVDRQFGFLKETLVAPVSRMQVMVGRTLGGATVAIIQAR